eukprot:CAMPEP_0175632766 /NCGR_PEP_ID=MMETSP0097-20121207/293_1 /TAXON_ID=311494 /ORGANISM="Alexandrium monilatum, Strain CCMP3105" /LENGTH=139 /DNA_ID=CAMNT_0016938279 /DNA_START=161 /DNA_END=577 /DNA_ORIENTATION=-
MRESKCGPLPRSQSLRLPPANISPSARRNAGASVPGVQRPRQAQGQAPGGLREAVLCAELESDGQDRQGQQERQLGVAGSKPHQGQRGQVAQHQRQQGLVPEQVPEGASAVEARHVDVQVLHRQHQPLHDKEQQASRKD